MAVFGQKVQTSSNSTSISTNCWAATCARPSEWGSVTSLTLYINPTVIGQVVRGYIYTGQVETSHVPYSKIATSSTFTVAATGWQEVTLTFSSPPIVSPLNYYYLTAVSNNAFSIGYSNLTNGRRAYATSTEPYAASTLPDTLMDYLPSSGATSSGYCVYATYTPVYDSKYQFGDGSNGALDVASGTTTLSLGTKYQYTDVTIASGATLTVNESSNPILYIACQGTFTLDGTINLSQKVSVNSTTANCTIDSVKYTSTGVRNGGSGQGTGGTASGGYGRYGYGGGGGGSSGYFSGTTQRYGGAGGHGGPSPSGGGGRSSVSTGNFSGTLNVGSNGNDGSDSRGGGGNIAVYGSTTDTLVGIVNASTSGAGGSHGANGGGGSSPSGTWAFVSGSGTLYNASVSGGGGGGGGQPGKQGATLIIIAKKIILNGTITSVGGAGQNGGAGGVGYARTSDTYPSLGSGGYGGGGAGANGGNIVLAYSDYLEDNSTKTLTGGSGGLNGLGNSSGGSGLAGTTITQTIATSKGAAQFFFGGNG